MDSRFRGNDNNSERHKPALSVIPAKPVLDPIGERESIPTPDR